MYGRILGFQRLARCPKWTPASIRSFTWTMATHCPPAPRRQNGLEVVGYQRTSSSSWYASPCNKGEEGHRSTRRGEGQMGFDGKKTGPWRAAGGRCRPFAGKAAA